MSKSLIAAVVLAAGGSSRMGTPKQVLKVGGKPMLQRVLDTLRLANVDRVIVVLGAHEAEVRRSVEFHGETVLVNADYAAGMSASIRAGVAAVPDAEAVLIVLGDQPFLSPSTVAALIEAYRNSGRLIVVPVHAGRRGNPVLFDRRLFAEVMAITGDSGAKAVVQAHEGEVLEVPVEDAGVTVDIDTSAEYERLKS